MGRRVRVALSQFLSVAGFSLLVFAPEVARAEPNDAAALELDAKAIEGDYLGTKFADAEKKLKQALDLCGPKSCSSKVVAKLHRDLGVVYAGGMNKPAEAKAEFAAAVKSDPSIALDPDLKTEEMEALFNEAKGSSGGGGQTDPTPPKQEPTGPVAPTGPTSAQGDLVHTPPPEQTVLTPVPLYVELPEGVAATKVLLQYRPFGASTWKTVEMPRIKQGFGAEVPCLDVGGVTGQLKYFIQAFDADNNMVAFSGTRNAPLSVEIKQELARESPHLPGQAPPARCPDTGDCPPEFPGCTKKDNPDACPEGEVCDKPKESEARKNWFSLGLQQDFLLLSGVKGTCSGGNDYGCFSGDDFYEAIPYDKSGGELAGGFAPATTRILLGYDRLFGKNFLVGIRAGFALGGGPQAPGGAGFVPVHAEVRASYWFGADPFAGKGLRGYVTVGGGLAQIDASVPVTVYNTEADYIADRRLVLDAWKKSGLVFVGAGGGLMYAIRPNHGPVAELRFLQLLGASGTAVGTTIGYSYGF